MSPRKKRGVEGGRKLSPEQAAAAAMVAEARQRGLELTGPDGLLKLFTKNVLETALNEEMTEHLGHEKNQADRGRESTNVRNGARSKTVVSDAAGEVSIEVLHTVLIGPPRPAAQTRRATPHSNTHLVTSWLLPWTLCAVSYTWAAVRTRPVGAVSSPPATLPAVDGVESSADQPTSRAGADPAVRIRRLTMAQLVVTVAAAGAAVLWAIGMVVLQPMTEPAVGSLGENNTYWVRDLRWDAIVALVLAVVVCARAQPRIVGEALVGGLTWLTVDIGLDRVELSRGTVPLAVTAAGVAVLGCWRGITGRGTSSRAGLLIVAAVAAVLSGVSLITESPTDSEPALHSGSAAVTCTLTLVAIGAALSAAPRSPELAKRSVWPLSRSP